MAIGVFGLQVAYRLKRLEVMSLDDTHGWFGGGGAPGTITTVDRIDFSNDTGTANIRSPSSLARQMAAATGNSNYGWFGGGYFGGPSISTVDRIDFSNDNATASVRAPLSAARYQLAATGNSNYGWFGGGTPNGSAVISIVDRIDFSNDSSTASPRGRLSGSKRFAIATGNSNYGWFGGGSNPALPIPQRILSTVDRIDFSNDSSTASLRGPLSSVRYQIAATGNSNYGWFGGGGSGGSSIDRIDFSNDSATALQRGPLSASKYALAATGNSNYGWFGGGNDVGVISTVDRIDFSNDLIRASVRGPLSSARYGLAATSGQAKGAAIKLAKTLGYGWFGGGLHPGGLLITVDRIDFSNDSSTASPRGPLSLARSSFAATGNSNYGWFGGGSNPSLPQPRLSTVDRINFSNDLATASVRGVLSSARYQLSATGNSNYGWFGGGQNPALPVPQRTLSTVDRINFSNDLATASVRGVLSSARYQLSATGNSNYGWFGGGSNPLLPQPRLSTVDRINFSNDLATVSRRGPLSAARYSLAATGNSNYGWFGGGYDPSLPLPQGRFSTVDRIDFSNDLAAISQRSPLSSARYRLSATGNSNYGWFVGGGFVGIRTVERIDFSNDLATISPRGPLSLERRNNGATSNTPIG